MKKFKLNISRGCILLCILIICLAGVLSACTLTNTSQVSVKYMNTDGTILKEEMIGLDNLKFDFVPTKVGYVFDGWYTDVELKTLLKVENISGSSISLFAKWEAKSFTVTFSDSLGNCLQVNGENNQIVKYGEQAIAPNVDTIPKIVGKTFTGWDKSFSEIKEDLQINAVYTTNSYKIFFMSQGQIAYENEIKYQTSLLLYANTAAEKVLAPEGKQFDCWCSDEMLTQKVDFETFKMPSQNTTLFAKFSLAQINTIALESFYVNGANETKFTETIVYDENMKIKLLAKGDLSANIQYKYNWYKVDGGIFTLLATTDVNTYNVESLSVGAYFYKVEVFAKEGVESVTNIAETSFSVTRKNIVGVTADNLDLTYNGLQATLRLNGILPSDTFEYKLGLDEAYQNELPVIKNVGNYNVYFRVTRANYFSYEGNCTVKINKANLTISPDDLLVTYGDEKPQFTMSCVGLVNGEKLADVLDGLVIFSCNYIKDNDISAPYPISASATSKNYKIIIVEGKLTVIPKKLVITVNPLSIYFGDNSPTYLADFNGFVNNQDASTLGKKFSISSNYSKGQSVGSFDIVAKDFENKNYDISAINGTLTVSPKPLDENFIFGLSGNYIYNGAAQNPIFTLTWNNQNLVSSSDYAAVASNNINAGEGKVSITGKGNYCGNIARAFEIKKSSITVKANLTEVIFKSAMPSFSASVTEGQLAQSDTLSSLDLVFDCAYTSNSSVGDYVINLTLGKNSNPNYLVTCLNGNIKVSAKNIADFIATVNGSYTYSGLEIMPNVNLQWGDIALSLTTDFTVSAKNNINASELAEVTLTGRGNYVGTKTQKFTIKKQPLKITANAQTITYGDVKPSFSAKFIGLVNNETQSNLVGTLNYECSYVAGNAAMTYVITPSGLTSDNYLITFENAILTVNKKDISISCNETNVYNGSVWERSFNSAIGMINGHVFSGTLQTLSAEVGTYTVVGDKLVNFKWKVPYAVTNSLDNVTENYNLHYDISVAISKSDIKFSANGFSGNYDGLPHFGNISTTTPNCTIEYSTDNIEFLSTVPAFIYAGNYKVYYKISNSQYNTQTGNYLVVINKAILSISANDCQTVFNSPIPTYSVAYVGLQNNENANIVLGGTLSYSCLYKQGSAVNTYAITPSGLTSDNYTINFVAGALKVSAKNISDFIATVNGSYTYSGLEIMPNVNLQWGDIALSLTTDFTVSAKNNINASELAEVTLTGRGNYVGTKTQKFTIKKQPLKITANAQTITYGDVKPSFSAKFIGLVNNETQSNLVGTLNYECSYVAGNAAKTYVITPSGLTSDNYLITFENAILTVNKKSLKITIDNKTITFNTVAPTYTYIMEGLLPADSINVQLLCGYVKGNNAASYPITAAPITNSNYNISIIDGALLVSPKDVPVVWQSNVFTYNGAIQTVSAYFVDINNQNVALDVTFSGAGAEFKYAGNYIATAVNNLNSSYNLTGNTRNYVIEKRSYTDAEIKVIVAKLLPSGLSATYSPTQKLSMISLPNGFIWNNPNEIPVPNGEYFASYNDDSANNNIYENVKMPIVIAKANATIDNAAKMQSFNYDGNNHSFVLDSIILKFNGEVIATSVAKVVYANGGAPDNAFSAGGTYKTLIKVESALYQGEFSVFVKICSVIIGSGTTFYTVEDAINISKTGETIIVKFNSSFSSDSDVKSSFYNNLSYYTIKNGVKLLVPYDEAATVKTNKFIKEGGVLGTVFRSLTVPSGVNIFVDGEIIVNAQRSHHSTIHMGHTAGDYGLMDVQSGSTIILNSGSVLNCNGYIIGGGNIEALSGSKIYDVLAVKDFRGGKVSSKIFDSMFPFSQYSINNIEINIKINCGAEFSARFGVYTQFSTVIGEMIVVGNGAIFSLSSGYVLKSFDIPSGKMELSLNGNMTTNSTKINIGLGVNIDTANVEFPIPGNFEIKIKSGSTCDINSRFKFLPGSKLTVDEGATLNIGASGKAYFYGDDGSDKVFAENWSHISYSGAQASGNSRVTYKYLYTDIAQFIVNGSVNVLGAVGGVIKTEGSSGIIVLNNATLTGTTNENAGNVLSPLITVTFTTKGDIGGSGNANLENATYKAQNGKWIKQ